jgi:hypothetical protein
MDMSIMDTLLNEGEAPEELAPEPEEELDEENEESPMKVIDSMSRELEQLRAMFA